MCNIFTNFIQSQFLAFAIQYFFIDKSGWEFPKYLEILKRFDIYKAQEDYLNLNLEEPIDFGDFPFILIYVFIATSKSNSMEK